MNFTWFASAYDVDDVAYRLLTFVQIIGVLILAAGVPAAFRHGDFSGHIGYVVMRVALVTQWLRAAQRRPVGAICRPALCRGASRWCRSGWIARLFLPHLAGEVAFYVLALAEMIVPAFAEWGGRGTAWHPEHISERYGLFTLIVLGECVAAATVAMQAATIVGALRRQVGVATGGLLLIFSSGGGTSSIRPRRGCGCRGTWPSCGATPTTSSSPRSPPWALDSNWPWRAPSVRARVSPTTAGGAVAVAVSVYLLVTGVVLGRLRPGTVLKMRFIVPFAVLLLSSDSVHVDLPWVRAADDGRASWWPW